MAKSIIQQIKFCANKLKRNGRPEWWVISNGLKFTTKAYLYTAPIVKSDIDLNPDLEQNPGYEY